MANAQAHGEINLESATTAQAKAALVAAALLTPARVDSVRSFDLSRGHAHHCCTDRERARHDGARPLRGRRDQSGRAPMTPLVTFWLVLVMPNHEPLRLTTPMSLAECLFEVNEFLAKP